MKSRNLTNILSFVLAMLLGGVTAAAPARTPAPPPTIDLARDKYEIDSAHSLVGFSIDFMGLTKVEGRFNRYSGTVLYDESEIMRSSVTLMIRTGSIDTGSEFRDNHLKTADFFDAEKFPFVIFQSTSVEKQGEGFILRGPLTMHGVTREVAIACRRTHPRTTADMWGNPRVGFEGHVTLSRKEFGIGSSPRWERVLETGAASIGDAVEVRLSISVRILNFDRISGGPNSTDTVLWKTFEEKGFEAAAAQYKEMTAAQPQSGEEPGRREGGANTFGYKLLWRNKVKEAIEVFQWNVAAFPNSANAYDSLAEAYARNGERSRAIENYKKSLALNPNNPNAIETLRHLER